MIYEVETIHGKVEKADAWFVNAEPAEGKFKGNSAGLCVYISLKNGKSVEIVIPSDEILDYVRDNFDVAVTVTEKARA